MKIDILTLFPDMFAPLFSSIIGRAVKANKAEINIVDIRDYSTDAHNKCDDEPFGGGAGMVMTVQPIYDAIQAIDPNHKARRIYTSPKGKVFSNDTAKTIAQYDHVIILCGHYEGVDQRAIDLCIDEELSIGDYVLTGGELAAMVIVDSSLRFVDGVLGCDESSKDESFSDGLLEYPQYTRPREFCGLTVPQVLLDGNHAKIAKWRKEQSEAITADRRPDLLEKKR